MSEGNAVEGEKIEKLTTIKYSERDKEKEKPGKRNVYGGPCIAAPFGRPPKQLIFLKV